MRDTLVTPLWGLANTYVQGRYRRGEISGPSARANEQTLRTLCASYGNRPVNQLGPAAIERWCETIAHLAPSTRRNHVCRVRKFCLWLVAQGHIKRDPCRDLRPVRQPRRLPVTLTPEQVGQLFASLTDLRAKVVVALMWDAGARCLEVAHLRVEDYDPIRRTVFLRGKGGHERVVPLSRETAAIVDRYLDTTGVVGGPLLRSRLDTSKGLAPETLSNYVSQWMAEAGVKRRALDGRSAHGLRRTCLSEVMEASGDIRVVQAVAGHADISTTARHYLRPVPLDRMRAVSEQRSHERSPGWGEPEAA